MRPRYQDLFAALLDTNPLRADDAFDAILFDRGEAIPDLVELYDRETREPRYRFYAIQLLGFTQDERAVPHVLRSLDDHDPMIRAEACRALEDLKARSALGVLRNRTQDLDPDVRCAAREAIAVLKRTRRAAGSSRPR